MSSLSDRQRDADHITGGTSINHVTFQKFKIAAKKIMALGAEVNVADRATAGPVKILRAASRRKRRQKFDADPAEMLSKFGAR